MPEAPLREPHGAHLRANGIRQHYLRFPGNAARPLLLIPGIASTAAMWGFVGEALAPDHDVFVLDVRGRGLSEAGPGLDYGLDALADDMAGFAAAAGLAAPVLLGHSMGARIAIRAARRHPGRFAALLLADPPVSGPGRRPYPSALAPLLALIQAGQRGEAEAVLRAPGQPAWPEPHLLRRAEWLASCDERAVTEAHRSFHEDDIHADLPLLDLPVALLAAGRGGVIGEEDVEEIRTLLPGLLFRRLAGAGHQMQIDDTGGFLALARELLTALR